VTRRPKSRLTAVLCASGAVFAIHAQALPQCTDFRSFEDSQVTKSATTTTSAPRTNQVHPLNDGRWITRDGKISTQVVDAVGHAPDKRCSPYPAKDMTSGKFGYKSTDGQWLVQPIYRLAEPFEYGRAIVELDVAEQVRKVGGREERFRPCSYLRLNGTQLSATFASCFRFIGALAYAERVDATFGMINRDGELTLPYVQVADWPRANVRMSEGLVALRDAETDKVGYADAKGNWVIKPRFAQGFEHHEGLAAVTLKDGSKVGFIDRTGRVVIPFKYGTNFGNPPIFTEGLALVSKDNYWPLTNLDPPARLGFIDMKGAWKISPRFSSGQPFKAGLARVYIGEKELYIDRNGKVIWPKK
jgi:hypothetical protein